MKWAMRLGAIGVMLALSLGLTACGGGSSSSGGRSGVSASYTVGGTVSGLASGQSLTLQNNGGFDLVVTANGSFTFIAAQPTGASYAVTVLTQPNGQTCTVANGSGTVSDSDITNVAVTCWTESVLYSFTGQPNDGAFPYAGLVDVDGILYGTTYDGGTNNEGTVFEINPSTWEETFLFSFNGNDGANPYAGLVDVDGILYGTTYEGGTSGDGTVFEINPSTGQETVLYSFTGTDGVNPVAGLVDVGGILYGTTDYGGTSGDGTVFEINPSTQKETVLYSFTDANGDGASPTAGLVIGTNGNLYGTTYNGGTSGDGTVFEINPSTGKETVLYSFSRVNNLAVNDDGAYPEAGLVDVDGTLYGTTEFGGTSGDGTVFEINPSTGQETVLYSFSSINNVYANGDGAYPEAGLVLGSNGTLYGTTFNGGTSGDGTVFEINPSTGEESVLHSFTGGADGALPEAGLLDVGGILYGTTYKGGTDNDGTVFRIVP